MRASREVAGYMKMHRWQRLLSSRIGSFFMVRKESVGADLLLWVTRTRYASAGKTAEERKPIAAMNENTAECNPRLFYRDG